MIEEILVKLKSEREVNYKRYQSSNIDHFLHYCSGLDRAIQVIQEAESVGKNNDLPMCEIDKSA